MHYRIEKWSGFMAPNPAMLRLTLENEGYTVYQWHDQPNAAYGSHKHEEEQSHWIISGRLEITIDRGGSTYLLGPGDRDFVPAETYHSARVIGEEAVFYLIGAKR